MRSPINTERKGAFTAAAALTLVDEILKSGSLVLKGHLEEK
jgi:hypothetical protein